jgi:hypothetical protein
LKGRGTPAHPLQQLAVSQDVEVGDDPVGDLDLGSCGLRVGIHGWPIGCSGRLVNQQTAFLVLAATAAPARCVAPEAHGPDRNTRAPVAPIDASLAGIDGAQRLPAPAPRPGSSMSSTLFGVALVCPA